MPEARSALRRLEQPHQLNHPLAKHKRESFGSNGFQNIAVIVVRPVSDRIEGGGLTCAGSLYVLQVYPRSIGGEVWVFVVRINTISGEGDQGVLLLPPLGQLKRKKRIRDDLG